MEALETTDQIDILDILEEYYDDGEVKEEPQCWTASIERLKQSEINDEANAVLENSAGKTSKCPLEESSSSAGDEESNAKRRKIDNDKNKK